MAERLKDKAFEAAYTDARAAYDIGLMSEGEFAEIRKMCLRDDEPSRFNISKRRPTRQPTFAGLMPA